MNNFIHTFNFKGLGTVLWLNMIYLYKFYTHIIFTFHDTVTQIIPLHLTGPCYETGNKRFSW